MNEFLFLPRHREGKQLRLFISLLNRDVRHILVNIFNATYKNKSAANIA